MKATELASLTGLCLVALLTKATELVMLAGFCWLAWGLVVVIGEGLQEVLK